MVDHLDEFGTAPDGRLFRGVNGAPGVPASVHGHVWAKAQELALSPAQVASPLARRPYDLGNAAVSTWLNAGVKKAVRPHAGKEIHVVLDNLSTHTRMSRRGW